MELVTYLKEKEVWHRFVDKPETTHTADAAGKTGIELRRVTKSLVLLNDNKEVFLAIIPGDKKLSFAKMRGTTSSKKMQLVPFEEASVFSGYLPGATPMVCHKEKMRVVLDSSLTSFETIYGGGGTRTRLLELLVEDVIKLNEAVVADIIE
jgi:Cys-tRNA(Pro)/Cys-tRNA(Cys) deacylase